MKYSYLFTILISTLIVGGLAHANGFGTTLDKVMGDYIVNVDYDSFTPEIDAGAPVRFGFQLWNKDRSEPIDFTTAWVRIAPKNGFGIVFAGTLGVPDFGPTGMSYVFSNSGIYELTARFNNKDKTLTEASFPLTVVGSAEETAKKQSSQSMLISGFVGLVIGAVITFFLRKRV